MTPTRWALVLLGTACLALSGCSDASYESYQQQEDRLMAALAKIHEAGGSDPRPNFQPMGTCLVQITLGDEWRAGNDGLALFEDVPQVDEFTLDTPTIDETGLEHLVRVRQLVALHFQRTVTTDAALGCLLGVRGPGLVHLKSLRRFDQLILDGTPILDDGLRDLAGAARPKVLSLKSTAITEKAATHLAAMKGLEVLSIDATAATEHMMAKLQTLPSLKTILVDGRRIDVRPRTERRENRS